MLLRIALVLSHVISPLAIAPEQPLALATVTTSLPTEKIAPSAVSIPEVPFYSQFKDISSTSWQKKGCGVASLAMVIEYYKPDSVSVNTLLSQAIKSGAYQEDAGWTHKGLISLSKNYGLNGKAYDLTNSSTNAAYEIFSAALKDGPVIASVHYKFDPKSSIPHLVVIDGIKDGVVYYNDPAAKGGEEQISVSNFKKAWKQKFIVVRPTQPTFSSKVT